MAELRAQRRLLFSIAGETVSIGDRLGEVHQWRQHAATLIAANRQLLSTIEDLREQICLLQLDRSILRSILRHPPEPHELLMYPSAEILKGEFPL